MLRLLIKDITVEKQPAQRKAVLHIRWQGGAVEDRWVDLPLPAPDRVRYPEVLVNRVRSLALGMVNTFQFTRTTKLRLALSGSARKRGNHPRTPAGRRPVNARNSVSLLRYEIPALALRCLAVRIPAGVPADGGSWGW